MLNITQIPAPRVEFIDPRTGLMSREWYRFFLNLFTLTGGGTNQISLEDVQLGPIERDLSPMDAQIQAAALLQQPNIVAQLAELAKTVEGMASAPIVQPESQHLHYGAFQDNTTQTAAVINTAYAITFDTTDYSDGVFRGTPTSRITAVNTGMYNIQFSLQMGKSSASLGYAWIWARINGTDVPDSAGRLAFQGATTDAVAAWNYVLPLTSGSYFELMWAVDSTAIQILHYASVAFAPAIPSAILTVTQVTL
jgi:hypothetical protein